MSSKRGRKRNDNLPPNRARDVQRAFRARRAAHLLALEQRVTELELENAKLRKMVGWPPDDRPPLGKGPTGKDKPKGPDSAGHSVEFFSSRDSGSADSSSRNSSLSPSALAGTSARTMPTFDPETWEHAFTMPDHHEPPPDVGQQPESPYQLPPMAQPVSTKPVYPYTNILSSSLPSSSSRSPVPHSNTTTNMYMNSPTGYSHSSERHLGGSYSSPSFVARGTEMRVESPREPTYNYHTPHQNHDHTMHPQSPPPPHTAPVHHSHSHSHMQQRDNATPYGHRRAATEQYTLTSHGLHLPNPVQLQQQQQQQQQQHQQQHQHNPRHTDLHRMHDATEQHQHQHHQHHHPAYRMAAYGPDGRINSMP
ncbi:hypothetical protein H0H81_007593 [Sphagnurus paluster]|uniref:BZIP domain-containing protein n=1 Tax=Sphagnurus paluster TaxID=117069 RepID=A0A9P7GLZ0_9AGAR|nr:hypothetical protein H0H81_007593 [Sphagnurus paluster]